MNHFQKLIARAKEYKPAKNLFMIGGFVVGGLVFLLIATLWPSSAPVRTQNTAGAPSSSELKGVEPEYYGEGILPTDKDFNPFKKNELPRKISAIEKNGAGAHVTVMKRDKGLVFGGRGFEATEFASKSGRPLREAFTRHLQRERPRMIITVKENLDLTQKEIKAAKPLIFHSRPAGFFKTAKRVENETDRIPARVPPFNPDFIPETKLLLSQGGESILLLGPAKNPIDLMENEDLSFKRYHQLR